MTYKVYKVKVYNKSKSLQSYKTDVGLINMTYKVYKVYKVYCSSALQRASWSSS